MSPLLGSRARKVVTGAVLTCVVFWVLQNHPQRPPSPSKNPQHFRDVVFRSDSRQIGANNHCDSRYANIAQLTRAETERSLRGLLTSLSKFMVMHHLEFWIAHGTLLGWYWNEKLLPWDTDVDVHVSGSSLTTLARQLNSSTYPEPPELLHLGYILDVNPFWDDTSPEDTANKIDARWIDRTNGKYIDITAVRSESSGGQRLLRSKDGHQYRYADVFPLLRTSIEIVDVLVPKHHEAILRAEYGQHALTTKNFHWHVFNETAQKWEYESGAFTD